MAEKKHTCGKYEKIREKLDIIGAWKRNGLTDEEIWTNLKIAKNTFYKYKKEHEEFCEVLKKNKEEADLTVENTAFKMANGFSVKVQDLRKVKKVYYDSAGRKIEEEKWEPFEKELYIPPNPTMTIFWLRNRKCADWNRRPGDSSGDLSGGGIIEIPMVDMPPQEIADEN